MNILPSFLSAAFLLVSSQLAYSSTNQEDISYSYTGMSAGVPSSSIFNLQLKGFFEFDGIIPGPDMKGLFSCILVQNNTAKNVYFDFADLGIETPYRWGCLYPNSAQYLFVRVQPSFFLNCHKHMMIRLYDHNYQRMQGAIRVKALNKNLVAHHWLNEDFFELLRHHADNEATEAEIEQVLVQKNEDKTPGLFSFALKQMNSGDKPALIDACLFMQRIASDIRYHQPLSTMSLAIFSAGRIRLVEHDRFFTQARQDGILLLPGEYLRTNLRIVNVFSWNEYKISYGGCNLEHYYEKKLILTGKHSSSLPFYIKADNSVELIQENESS